MSFKLAGDRAKIFISYRSREPDASLAQAFYRALVDAGHDPFMAGESIRLGEDWSKRIDAALEQCDYFLLLLSPQSAVSEMVTEEVRRAKQLKDTRPEQRPVLLPLRVCFPMSAPLNYDLRGYLQRTQQREWQSETDTPVILQEILSLIAAGQALPPQTVSPEASLPEASPSELPPLSPPPAFGGSGPPLPVAEPELPRGQVELESAFYVRREPLESRCYETVLQRAALIRIKAPRQMGKTSLMARILHQAEQQDYRIVPLTFQLTDESAFADLNQFLRRFCALVSRRLQISPKQVEEFWDADLFGPKDNCNAYFEERLLPNLTMPLVLALDEVDRLFPYERVAKEFFTLLRAWNEQSKTSKLWEKLRIVVVHSTEVYVVMDTNSSPFNVGLPIDLTDFTPEQVQDLATRHGLNWSTTQVEALMALVGGHPYLVRLALYHIAKADLTLEQLLAEAATDAGIYGDHLRQHLWNLQRHPDLVLAIKQAIASRHPIRLDATPAFKLYGMGLVDLCGNDVVLRYNLYQQYFRDRLGI